MSLPPDFRINPSPKPFPPEQLATLPSQQRFLERALGGTKYVSRSVHALVKESGLNAEQVLEYCRRSTHIRQSPLETADGDEHYGYLVRLREKYHLDESGELTVDLDSISIRSGGRYDVFVSCTHADAAIAREIVNALRRRELTCFMAEKDVSVGGDWNEEIRSALVGSQFVVLLLTQRSRGRPWLLLETGAA